MEFKPYYKVLNDIQHYAQEGLDCNNEIQHGYWYEATNEEVNTAIGDHRAEYEEWLKTEWDPETAVADERPDRSFLASKTTIEAVVILGNTRTNNEIITELCNLGMWNNQILELIMHGSWFWLEGQREEVGPEKEKRIDEVCIELLRKIDFREDEM